MRKQDTERMRFLWSDLKDSSHGDESKSLPLIRIERWNACRIWFQIRLDMQLSGFKIKPVITDKYLSMKCHHIAHTHA